MATTTITYKEADMASIDRPDFQPAVIARQRAATKLVRDVMRGTTHIRALKTEYLPKNAKEDDETYERRVAKAVLFNATERTVEGLVGMVFRKDPVVSDEPPVMTEHLENIDNAGRALSVFAKDIFTDMLADGHVCVVIDMPRALTSVTDGETGRERQPTLADERREKRRPYWIQVRKDAVVNVQWEYRNGRAFVTLFVYREEVALPRGAFGEQVVERFRVLRPGSFEVWQREIQVNAAGKEEAVWHIVDSGMTSLSFVPVVVGYADRVDLFESCPPLEDLAHENVGHYQARSAHEAALDRARIAMPFFKGMAQQDIQWGADYAIFTENASAEAEILEISGASLEASLADLRERKGLMATLGLQMLSQDTRAAETAEAKDIDKSESDSRLATAARGLQDMLEEAVRVHAMYIGADALKTKVEVNTDFRRIQLAPALLKEYREMVASGDLTIETLWSIMQSYEALPEDFDEKAEAEMLEDRKQSLDEMRALAEAEAAQDAQTAEGEADDEEDEEEDEE